MFTAHQFQTPRVRPLDGRGSEADESVLLIRMEREDVDRIVRALDEVSLQMAPAPGGARGATAYRRLAATIRAQADAASPPSHHRYAAA